jgi:hypothetical protein
MNDFELEIITPEAALPKRRATSIDVPAEFGRLMVLAGHEPFICCLREGPARVGHAMPVSGVWEDENGGEEAAPAARPRDETWQLGRGTLSVAAGNVTLLVRRAELVEKHA